jgi:hypothetical protein
MNAVHEPYPGLFQFLLPQKLYQSCHAGKIFYFYFAFFYEKEKMMNDLRFEPIVCFGEVLWDMLPGGARPWRRSHECCHTSEKAGERPYTGEQSRK